MALSSKILAGKQPSLQNCLHAIADSNEVFLLDGGTGEELFRRGVPDDRKIWSAMAVVDTQYHAILEQVHSSFLQAGARAITTNSYGIVPGVEGFEDAKERSRHIGLAGEIARRAVTKLQKQHQLQQQQPPATFVLGSLGPLVESYRPDLIRPHRQGVEEYLVACRALQPHVDAFLAETMSCWEESSQALDAVSSLTSTLTTQLPVMLSYTLDSNGNLRDGDEVTECLTKVLDYTQEKKIDLLAILFNCCQPEAITLALARIVANTKLYDRLKQSRVLLGAYANRLTAVDPNWTMVNSECPQPFRRDLDHGHYWNDFVKIWTSDLGVKLVGGCCGMTPEHISYIHSRLPTG